MSNQKKLIDAQFARLVPLLRPPSNHFKILHRQVLDAWLYVLYQGCTCRGLQREAWMGVDLDALSLDSTIVKIHVPGTGAPRTVETGDRTLGRRPDLQSACGRGQRTHPAGALALIWLGSRRTDRSRPAARARPGLGPPGPADGARLRGRPHPPPGRRTGQ